MGRNYDTYTSVVRTGTVVPGVIVGETGESWVMELVGVVSAGILDSGTLDTGVECTEVLGDSGVVIEGVVTKPVGVYIDEMRVVSGMVTGTVGPVGPAEVVELTVGIGYGFVSWGIEETSELYTGVELGTGGFDDAGPQLKFTL